MRVATPDGYAEVTTRSWPLAGLDMPTRWHNGDSLIELATLPGGGYQAATYAQIYRTNPWIFTAVQAYSRGLSRLRLKTYQYDADGNRERIRSDLPGSLGRKTAGQSLDALFRQPEPEVGRQEWLRKIIADKKIYGNALVYKEINDVTRQVTALYHVPWRRVTVMTGDTVPILGYEVRGTGGFDMRRFLPNEVVHFGRGSDPDSPIGLSPIAPLKFTLALHDALWRHAVAYFQNSARPSGMVKLDRNSNEKTIELIKSQIERLYTAPEAAGKILVTSGSWESMTDAPDQSQIVELARLSREEIAAGYGIPQPMMGILDRAILNNVKELRNYFTRDSIGEEAAAVEDDLMAQLVLPVPAWSTDGYFAEFDLGEALRPDLEARSDVFEKMRHVYTPDEMREMEGLRPLGVKESETVWMPAGQIGLGIEPPAPETPKGQKPTPTEPVDPSAPLPAEPDPTEPAAV